MLKFLEELPEAKQWPAFSQWLDLLKKGDLDGVLEFLKEADSKDRKQLLSILNKIPYGHFDHSGSSSRVLEICRFVCFDNKDVLKHRRDLEWMLPEAELVLRILPWHKPGWFEETYNRLLAESRLNFSYEQCLTCERQGFIGLAPEAVAPRLVNELIQGLRTPNRLEHFLEKNPEVMARDAWALFTAEFWNSVNPWEFPNWRDDFIKFFVDSCAAGKLDRPRLLRECLSSVGRNLSNNQISLYLPLFAALKPDNVELLKLSGELLAVVASPHGKAAADALKLLNNIAADNSFPWREYIALLPVVLAMNVKSIQTPALALAEVLVKKNPQSRAELAPALAEAFGSPDEAVQLRAAKCLLACGEAAESTEVTEALALKNPSMAASVKDILSGLLVATAAPTENPEEYVIQARPKLDPAALIKPPADLDELVFLISSAFVEPADYHASLVPDALYAFRDQLNDEALARLGPAVTAARRTVTQTQGLLNSMVHSRTTAAYFLRWFLGRLAQSDSRDQALRKLKSSAEELALLAATDGYIRFKPRFAVNLVAWPSPALYYNFYHLARVVEAAFSRIDSGDPLPMLSSVTHAPFWIDPLILIERLRIWRKAGREPDGLDLQLAIQRCALEKRAEVLEALKNLKGEEALLLGYLFGVPLPPKQEISRPACWITAALTRPERQVPDELLGPEFADFTPSYFKNHFHWKIEQVQRWDIISVLTIDLKRHLLYSQRPENNQIMAELPLAGTAADLFAAPMLLADDHSLAHQALALYPNNPELPLKNYFLMFSDINSPQTLSIFQKLMELGAVHGPALSLFTALSFFSERREIRQVAAAFWRASAEESLVDSARLGSYLGALVEHNWAPIKRLTDLIETEMLNVSPVHSRQLAETLEVLLLTVGPEPKASIRRLLEIYYELVAAGARPFSSSLSSKTDQWSQIKAYDKVCRRLSKLAEA